MARHEGNPMPILHQSVGTLPIARKTSSNPAPVRRIPPRRNRRRLRPKTISAIKHFQFRFLSRPKEPDLTNLGEIKPTRT